MQALSLNLDEIVKNIPQDIRIEIFKKVVVEKKVKLKDLGIKSGSVYKYMILHGKRPVSNELLKKLLQHLTVEELIQLGVKLGPNNTPNNKTLNPPLPLSHIATGWAGSSAWKSARFAPERSRVQIPAGPPNHPSTLINLS